METHDSDPTTERDPWESVSAEFADLGAKLRASYHQVADESGPSEDDIKNAFSTLGRAWDQVADSVSTALKDPAIRDQLKDAVGSLATAVGATVTELGEELKKATPGREVEEE